MLYKSKYRTSACLQIESVPLIKAETTLVKSLQENIVFFMSELVKMKWAQTSLICTIAIQSQGS